VKGTVALPKSHCRQYRILSFPVAYSVPPLVFYHLVTVNYGEYASYNEAEEFGSAALGMNKEEYYQLLCHLTDHIEP
jgi:hypothetical protein